MKSKLRSIISSLRKKELAWRYGFNLAPTLSHRIAGNGDLSELDREVLRRLKSDGIAITSVEELFGESSDFPELEASVGRILEARKEEIAGLRAMANDETAIGSKTFNLELLGSEPDFDPGSVFARIALNEKLLNIANGYFRMRAKLRYYNTWQTFASNGAARESQLWHFDREDNYILKLFLYLDDVDEGAGPFTYAPGTQRSGRDSDIEPEFFLEGGVKRTTDEQMDAVFPKSKWVTGTGKKGTMILADTRGFHKGGEARSKDRLMYTCMYTSPASESRELLRFPSEIDTLSLNRKQRAALYIQ